jgi:hypothetical protein
MLKIVNLAATAAIAFTVSDTVPAYAGTDYNGTSFQGSRYQGTSYQGSSFQGTRYQGTQRPGTSATGAEAPLDGWVIDIEFPAQ